MVPKEKRWAKGLNQVEFERQWARRFPHADVIPLQSEWINTPITKTHGIDSIPPQYEFQPDGPLKEVNNGKDDISKLSK